MSREFGLITSSCSRDLLLVCLPQVVFWGTIIFLGFLLFHGFVLGVFHLSGRRPPAFAAFGTVELKFLAFLTPPVTDAAAGLFKKGSAGAIIVGIVLLLAVPVPVVS